MSRQDTSFSDTRSTRHGHPSTDVEKKAELNPVISHAPGEVEVIGDDGHGEYKRSFSKRQIHVNCSSLKSRSTHSCNQIIALGSNVGSGIFIGIGKALADGGPGNMLIAYLMVCTLVWCVLQTLSEMTIIFPTSGNFIDYADRWVDPALAFGAGFAEWLGWTAIVAAEAVFFVVLVGFWADGKVPVAVLCTFVDLLGSVQPPADTPRSDTLPHRHLRHLPSAEYVLCLVRVRDVDHQDFPLHLNHHRRYCGRLRCGPGRLCASGCQLYRAERVQKRLRCTSLYS